MTLNDHDQKPSGSQLVKEPQWVATDLPINQFCQIKPLHILRGSSKKIFQVTLVLFQKHP